MDFPQTSLIPSALALSKFFIENFPNFWWYPYWYLGNPFNYLIGPVVPLILFLFSKLGISLDFAYLTLIFLSLVSTSLGIYFLVKKLGGEKKAGIFAAFIFLILPGTLLSLNIQNGLKLISFGLIPWILILFLDFFKKNSLKTDLLLCLLITIGILIDISILLPIFIGLCALFLSSWKENLKNLKYLTLRILSIFLISLSFATIWYTPPFWVNLLFNPSIGGKSLISLLKYLYDLLLNILPVILAFYVVKLGHIKLSRVSFFALIFLSSYLFLSLVRFIFDPDFVLDWVSHILEIQFGASILLGVIFNKLQVVNFKFKVGVVIGVILVLVGWVMALRPWFDADSKEYKQDIISMLKNIPPSERVFLSGSSVFWINSSLNLMQVRGGADSASINPFWADGAYQIREGEEAGLTKKWLQKLETKYVLVHDKQSVEYFKDFKHPEKFKGFKLILEKNGNYLYEVE